MNLSLYNYETIRTYVQENVDQGFLYLEANEEYEILVNKEVMTHYANKIGVCLKYLDPTQHIEIQEDAFKRLEKALSKLLGFRWIRFIPKSNKGKELVTIESTNVDLTSNKFYAVTGIFTTWEETVEQVKYFPDNCFKRFSTFEEAEQYLKQ